VTDHGEQLREAFETHERLAPDAAAVYDRVLDLSRTYKRRRRTAQVAGGAVLGAGLLTGAIALPGMLLPKNAASTEYTFGAPAPSASASAAQKVGPKQAVPATTVDPNQKGWDAYFRAGYDYNDAVRLAHIWKSKDSIGDIKAEAGRKLLAGETLPIKPNPKNVAAAKENAELDAYFAAGYGYDDAVKLADLWKLPDAFAAKVEGGKRLLAGETLPIQPGPPATQDPAGQAEQAQVDAFFAAGYNYDDAARLADMWKLPDPYSAKVEGGKRLLAGETLPIQP
jgi:hypothetical protein